MTTTLILEFAFWTSVGAVLYCYAGFPVVLGSLAKCFGKRQQHQQLAEPSIADRDQAYPFVSIIIAAYKEENVILERLNNAALLDYPRDRYEVLIGCDGNEDSTGELVEGFQDPNIKLCQYPQRRGKPSVLNDTIEQAQGEIVAFSDANTFWERDALKRLVRHFQNESVGGVCGQLCLKDPDTGENVDGVYWKYENILKRWEGQLGALLGVNGAIYAIRRELWEPIPANSIVDDFLIGMRIHLKQKQLVFDETAIANEESAPNISAEFHRRARIGAGGFQSLCWLTSLLNPKYGFTSFAFWSHKVLRWLCPLFMACAFVCNLGLLSNSVFQLTMVLQCLFYGTALIGRHFSGAGKSAKLIRLTTMFTDMNLALLVGFWRWASNRQSGAWKRTERSAESANATPDSQSQVAEFINN